MTDVFRAVAPRPAPVRSAGMPAWVRRHLFADWRNGLTTLLLLAIGLFVLQRFTQWGVVDAIYARDPDACQTARGIGASHTRMMFRHILPQCVAPFLILATTHLGVAIVIEASLGFLGVGIPPPMPTWGNMLSDALNSGLVPPWWLVLFPGLAITLTVLAFNLLGDGIRDMLDPRLRGAV